MADYVPNYPLVHPKDVVKFAFPLQTSQEDIIKPYTNLFDRNFKNFINVYGKEGRKILLVTDRIVDFCVGNKGVEENDIDRNVAYSGKEGAGLQNILAYTVGRKKSSVDLKEIAVFCWEAGRFKFKYNSTNTADIASKQQAYAVYLERLIKLIKAYKPDCVVVAGVEIFEYIYAHLKQNFESNKRMFLSRLVNCSLEVKSSKRFSFALNKSKNKTKFNFKLQGTVDLYPMISWDAKPTKHPNLIGFFSDCLVQAINGANKYTVSIPHDARFIHINTIDKFDKLMRNIRRNKIISIDTETASLGKIKNIIYTIQFCYDGKTGYTLPIDHPSTPFTTKERQYIKEQLCIYFETGKSLYHIYQNGKFDIMILYACVGIRYYNHRVYDIQNGEFSLNENIKLIDMWNIKSDKKRHSKPYALDFIAERYGCSVYRQISFSKGNRGSISTEGLTKRFIQYACFDVIIPFLIHEKQIQEAKSRKYKKFMRFVCEMLGDVVIFIAQMEHTGIYLDKKQLFLLKSKDGPINKIREGIIESYKDNKHAQRVNDFLIKKHNIPQGSGIFGDKTWVFNLRKDEHKQLFFFKALGLTPLGEKKLGGFQTNSKFLKTYSDVPEVKAFSEYQKAQTLRNNFIDPTFEKMKSEEDSLYDGRLRSNYDLIRVSTGRLSCLDGDTLVNVADARGRVKIRDIKAGDTVWTFDKNLKLTLQQVSWSGQTGIRKTLTICYDNGIVDGHLICTPEHPIRLPNGKYIEARYLQVNDKILGANKDYPLVVAQIKYNDTLIAVYDITVPIHHNFIANGICVHNSFGPNLQNIPVRGEYAKHIKRMFIAEQGSMGVETDYSAAEVKELANQAYDEILKQSFYTGLQSRRKLRMLAYKYEENIEEWFRVEKRSGWHDKDERTKIPKLDYEAKIAIIKSVNNPITQEVGKAVLEIESKGDAHRINANLFFEVDTLKVTDDQRYDIKSVVFAVCYGKTAQGLSKPKAELGLGKPVEYCQELIDKFYDLFKSSSDLIKQIHKQGRENLYIESPIGMQRHLPGYLHSRPAIQNAFDRRGVNSPIQGCASFIGILTGRIIQRLIWHLFVKHAINISWKLVNNSVHDSIKMTAKNHNVPLILYLVEHASTTLVHKRLRDVFGYELQIGLEQEFGIGASADRVKKWDFSHANLYDRMRIEMEWQNTELGYNNNIEKEMKTIKHNWQIIRDIRLRELEKAQKNNEYVSYSMMMNEHNARDFGLVI